MLKRVVTIAVIAFLGQAGWSARADEYKPTKEPLPRKDTVEWDVAAFEDSATFDTIKREVKNGRVVWVLENRKDLGNEFIFGYQAEFLDEDGVKLMAVEIRWDPPLANPRKGDRNRLILELPRPENWKEVRKVVIKGV